jgi:hypothetical protein
MNPPAATLNKKTVAPVGYGITEFPAGNFLQSIEVNGFFDLNFIFGYMEPGVTLSEFPATCAPVCQK